MKNVIIFLLCIGLSPIGLAQTVLKDSSNKVLYNTVTKLNAYADTHPTEKIYLQLNKPWYSRGDTLWFKAYTVIGGKHQLSALSQVAYAELVSPNDTIIQKLNLSLRSGMASGDFTLPLTLIPGAYRVRAYTNWMKNEGAQYFYDQRVQVGSAIAAPPTTIAGSNKKDNKITTIATATTAASLTKTDIQFFPEGGLLISGLRNVVAFKATEPDGSGAKVAGTVTNSRGQVIVELYSGLNGMGSFAFTPNNGEVYTAKLQLNDGTSQSIDLPKANIAGYTLTVNNSLPDTLLVKIAASANLFKSEPGAGFYLIAQSGGTVYYTTSGKSVEKAYSLKIPKGRFPTGIARLTLFSEKGEPLNERVVFIQQPDQLQLKANSAKATFAEGEKISIDLNASASGNQPAIGSFSAAVINESKVPADEMAEPTILSQLLLNSELHGNIQTPCYYLANQNPQTIADLDLLMLTQGYRKLEWKKLLDTTQQQPEYLAEDGLSVSGTVKTLSGKPVNNGKVSLISSQLFLKIDTTTDANGHFNITGINVEDKAPVLIKAMNGKSDNVKIALDPNEVKVNPRVAYALKDTATNELAQALKNSYRNEDEQYIKAKGKILKEVTIRERYDPAKKRAEALAGSSNRNGPGNADQIIMGDVLENSGCADLAGCLAAKLFAVSTEKKLGTVYLWDISRGHNAIIGASPMNIFVDGSQAPPFDASGNVAGISASDIQSVEVLTSTKYKSIYGHDAAGGLILITTKRGIAKFDRVPQEKAPGIISFKFDGFYKARTFYQPKYEANDPAEQQRSAIYWQPDILTYKDGKASLHYNNAGKGNYRVVVEGIDGEGRLGRAVYRYKVE